ncbi:alpha/beta hydrolase [Nocardia terpenica]|nr:alpha/beta hydrolase [Nocardia terpenica]MBF6107905.1 alpha/beta hydrolase [Nocardia terpenica]MBF6115564.1 alpha/beta hydrolase [Nocardia terpenica]MBF6122001.1 alpha/beta hydrolase [Nocardia terpenica]MBF6155455.1 alpha/beta hydrolase [Nocardia terpenica]
MPARLVGGGTVRVIAAHDWLVPTGAWGPFCDYLDGERFTYALLDARGYGARRSVTGEYSMREWARDIIALADQLGWDEFCLVGHSMGAKAAQQAMADAPHRVRRLAALAPTPPGPVQLDASQRTLFENAVHSPHARRELVDYSTGRRAGAGWLNYMVRASFRGSTPAAFAAYADSFVHDDLTADVAGIPVPVKVIAGKHDQATSEHQVRSIWPDIYPNFQLQVLTDAGHYPMHETPVALAAAVESFLT